MTENKGRILPENITIKSSKTQFGLNPSAAADIQNQLDVIMDKSYVPPENPYLVAADNLKSKIDEAEENSIKDSLTGLYNRRYLDNYINRFDNSRNKKPVVVAFCDADDLGAINKLKGDIYGDRLIQDIANTLKHSVRNEDLVIRKGGDEFVIIIEDYTNFDEVRTILTQRLNSNQSSETKFSFGIVEYVPSDKSLMDTIQRGNEKMKENNPSKKVPKH